MSSGHSRPCINNSGLMAVWSKDWARTRGLCFKSHEFLLLSHSAGQTTMYRCLCSPSSVVWYLSHGWMDGEDVCNIDMCFQTMQFRRNNWKYETMVTHSNYWMHPIIFLVIVAIVDCNQWSEPRAVRCVSTHLLVLPMHAMTTNRQFNIA